MRVIALLLAVLAAGLVGAWGLLRRQAAGTASRRGGVPYLPLLGTAAVAAGGSALMWWLAGHGAAGSPGDGSSPPEPALPQVIVALQRTGGIVLGRYLAAQFPGGAVTVLVSPEGLRDNAEGAMLDGLMQAASDACRVSVRALAAEGNGAAGAAHRLLWLSPAAFDAAASASPDAQAVVSLTGLPAQPEELGFWRRRGAPALILANSDVFLLRKMLASGRIRAVLVRRPWRAGEPRALLAPADEANWLLITTANVGEVQGTYRGLFAEE